MKIIEKKKKMFYKKINVPVGYVFSVYIARVQILN